MSHSVLRLALALLLPAALACAGRGGPQASEASEPEVVHLSFDWAPGLEAEVTATRSRSQGDEPEQSVTTRYRMRVQEVGDALRVAYSDFELVADEMERLPPSSREAVGARIAGLVPDIRVSHEGRLLGIDEIEPFRFRVRRFLEEMTPDTLDPETAHALGELRRLLTSEAYLVGRAAEQWNAMVGSWVGADLEIGSEYGFAEREAASLLPGEQVRMLYAFGARSRVPCSFETEAEDCVLLELHSRSDPEDTQRLIERFLERLTPGDAEQPPLSGLEVERHIELVTEPEGLRPHRLRFMKRAASTYGEGEAAREVEQIERFEAVYDYR